MNCPHCHTVLPDNAPYCPACGTMLSKGTPGAQPQYSQPNSNYAAPASQRPQPVPAYGGYAAPAKKKVPIVKILAIVIPAVLLVIIGLICLIRGLTTTSVSKFVNNDLVVEGYNGYASISESDVLDAEGLMMSIGGTRYSSLTDDEILNEILDYGSRYSVMDYIDIDIDKEDHLSNGDTVTATITVDKKAFNQVIQPKKKLVGKSTITKKYKIKDLEDPIVIDPFSIITSVSYDLTSSYGNTTIFLNESFNETVGDFRLTFVDSGYRSDSIKITDANLEDIGYITFSANSESYTSTKKITVSCDQNETAFISDGIVLSPVKKEYEPATVDYVKKAEEISVDDYNRLKESAIADAVSNHSDATFVNAHFAATNGSDLSDNELIFVFSYTDTWDNSTEYYSCTTDDLKITSDGKMVIDDSIYWYHNWDDDYYELMSDFTGCTLYEITS